MNCQTDQDARFTQMQAWLAHVLPGHTYPKPASSDASFRRYFRVFCDEKPWIVMDAPPEREDCRPFLQVCEQLMQAGVHVPKVHESDLEQGFLLLDDLGNETFLNGLERMQADSSYRAAIDELLRIQLANSQSLPVYDEALLNFEMSLFKDWYLQRHRERDLNAEELKAWERVTALLSAAALAQAQVFVHRDYHSRNLMWASDAALGVLDFQDAVHGPLSYDLVSLLRDCYVAWPAEQVQAWLAYYHGKALEAGLPVGELASFERAFDWMGIQRHLKAVGIFARLNHRDGKPGYLGDIPRTLAYIKTVSSQYPELSFLQDLVSECLD